MEPWRLKATEMARLIEAKELSPVELTESALSRIAECEPTVNAFVTVLAEQAHDRARSAEAEIARGDYRGPLHGIPVGIKDVIDTAGVRTTCSSKVRADYVPNRDAAVVASLKEAGAIIVGKTQTHEFAYGGITAQTHNPWDLSLIPGGSSGGSAAAVAYGGVPVALGTDTVGSIRIPAAVCGTIGLKPTFGRVPRTGIASLSWSLDHCGPLTRNVTEAAWAMNTLAGYDPRDAGSVNHAAEDFTRWLDHGAQGVRIGIPMNRLAVDVQPEVRAAADAAISDFESAGATLVDIKIPFENELMAVAMAILLPEAYAYHRRTVCDTPELFTEDVRARLELGGMVSAADYIDALRLRNQIIAAWHEMAADVDVVVAPAVSVVARHVDELFFTGEDDDREEITEPYLPLAIPTNLTGLPSLQIPSGFTAAGLPTGVQLIGKRFGEAQLLALAKLLEDRTPHVGRIAE